MEQSAYYKFNLVDAEGRWYGGGCDKSGEMCST